MNDREKARTPDLEGLIQAVQLLSENMKAIHRQVSQSESVIIFMDNSNFFGSVGRLGREMGYRFRVDYHKLYTALLKDRFCINAFCYYSDWDSDAETRHRRENFQNLMEKAGFQLVRFQQRPGATKEKGVDAAIVKDMVTAAHDCPRCLTFILIAGDGDYAETVRELRTRYGVKVEVAFFGADTAITLQEAAYRFIDLSPLWQRIELDRPFSE